MQKPKNRKRTDNLVTMPPVESGSRVNESADITDSDIAPRAYELYEQRGGEHGHHLDDWGQAERELRDTVTSRTP